MKKVTIEEATGFELTKKGNLINIETKKVFSPDEKGMVFVPFSTKGADELLELDANALVAKYFSEEKRNKKEKKVTGASLIREAYDKNPEKFDMKAFSEQSGIAYHRVYGCIKKYKASKEK